MTTTKNDVCQTCGELSSGPNCECPCPPRQRWTFSRRLEVAGNDFYLWHRHNEAGNLVDAWATPVAALVGAAA